MPGRKSLSALLIARLKKSGIREVAVIDEALDFPELGSIQREVTDFATDIGQHEDWQEELKRNGLTWQGEEELIRSQIVPLWSIRNRLSGDFGFAVETLFREYIDQRSLLARVVRHLRNLGVCVHCLGPKADLPEVLDLVFLDFNLDPAGGPVPTLATFAGNAATLPSVRIARKLQERKDRAPFLILFSDRLEASEIYPLFRKEAHYLGGTFAFLPKGEAREADKFYLHLAEMGLGHSVSRPAQQFFWALSERLETAAKTVSEEIMALEVQDYASIQRIALGAEGEPLGEYLLDLFGAVVSYHIRSGNQVQSARRALDETEMFGLLPTHIQPRMRVMDIYRAALTEPGVGPADVHPLIKRNKRWRFIASESGLHAEDYPPLLRIGDVFAKAEGGPVYLVVNAACDLQYSPAVRDPNPRQPVFLVPGQLELLDAPLPSDMSKLRDLPRTEVFEIDGKNWRVWWEVQFAEAVPLWEFSAWQERRKCERVGRLSLPYVLAVQHRWMASMGRVGLSVSFPIYDVCSLEVFTKDAQGGWVSSHGLLPSAVVLVRQLRDTKDENHFLLTKEGVAKIRRSLEGVGDQLTLRLAELVAAEASQKTVDRASERLAGATAKLQEADYWIDLLEQPKPLTRGPKWRLPTSGIAPVLFTWNESPAKGSFDPAAVVVAVMRPA